MAAASSAGSEASAVDTTMREADSPNSVAWVSKPASPAAAGTSTVTPMPALSNVHSASVTARPPSAQSCADSTRPSRMARTVNACSATSRARSSAGASPRTRPCITDRYSLPPSSPRLSPSSTTIAPLRLNIRVATLDASSSRPTTPSTGVGKMARPSVSLYRLTLPPVMGTCSARQASPMPRTASPSCHMISGRSGLPKFRLLVAPMPSPPAQATLREASATASMAPR